MSAATEIIVSPDLRRAREFMALLPNDRTPWSELLTSWSREHGLTAVEEKAVRITVLRLRTWGAIERSGRHRP